jgi:5'-methylthioadenosine phosphorylase
MALVTDYDCWHETHESVSVEQILGYLKANAEMAQRILKAVVPRAAKRKRDCVCVDALRYAIVTDPAKIPAETKQKLAPIIGRYVK